MSIDSNCGMMVGLPYKEMVKLFDDPEILDALIYEDTLSRSSIYYDSTVDINIVGIWVAYGRKCEVNLEELNRDVINSRAELAAMLLVAGTTFNVYLAVDIT